MHRGSDLKGVLAAILPVAALLLLAGNGCSTIREVADRGNRITEIPGARPAKATAMIGRAAGSLVGLPFTVLLLPTYPFEGLTYQSSPEHDIAMPILHYPVELAGGLGAFIGFLPFLPAKPSLGQPDGPSEWPRRDLAGTPGRTN